MSSLSPFADVKGRLPLLEHLILVLDIPKSSLSQPSVLDAFEVVPKLHTISINRELFGLQIRCPWSQITRLSVYDLNDLDWLLSTTLCHATSLEYLFLSSGFFPVLHVSPSGQVSLPSLRALHYTIRNSKFIDLLTLPRVEEIHLELPIMGISPSFSTFLQRSGPSPKHLSLTVASSHLNGVVDLLAVAPMILELTLTVWDIRNTERQSVSSAIHSLLSRLTYRLDGNLCLCPHLMSLTLEVYSEGFCDFTDFFDATVYADMIKSRWNICPTAVSEVARIQRAKLEIDFAMAESKFGPLAVLAEEGLHWTLAVTRVDRR